MSGNRSTGWGAWTAAPESLKQTLAFSGALVLFTTAVALSMDVRSPFVEEGGALLLAPVVAGLTALLVLVVVEGPLGRADAVPFVRAWIAVVALGWLLQLRVAPESAVSASTALHHVLAAGAAVGSIVVGTLLASLDRSRVKVVAVGCLATSLVILLATWVLGEEINGARAWIRVGGVTYQPGELARVLLVVAFAAALYGARGGRPDWTRGRSGRLASVADLLQSDRRVPLLRVPWRSASVAVLVVALAGLLQALQNDLSPIVLLGVALTMTSLTVLSVARLRVALTMLVVLAVGCVLTVGLRDSQLDERWDAMWHPIEVEGGQDATVTQLGKSLLASSRGLPAGTGVGRGVPQSVPVASSDFILSGLAEEWGLLGVLAVIGLLLYLLRWCWRVVRWAPAGFPQIVAAALSTLLSCQVVIVLATLGRLGPHGGLTVPFLSEGGSSLTALAAVVGLLIGVGGVRREEDLHTPIARRTLTAQRWVGVLVVGLSINTFVVQPRLLATAERNDVEVEAARALEPARASVVTADGFRVAFGAGGEAAPCDVWDDRPPRSDRFRCYPGGSLYADVTGYLDVERTFTATALEQVSARAPACERPSGLVRFVLGEVCTRLSEVPLTLVHSVQVAAQGQLGREEVAAAVGVAPEELPSPLNAAVVVSDPSTGDVVAMVSSPSYDPNLRARPGQVRADGSTLTFAETARVVEPDSPSFLDAAVGAAGRHRFDAETFPLGPGELDPGNRSRPIRDSVARTELFPVGSVMKMITAVPVIETPDLFVGGLPVRDEWNGRPNDGGPCGGSVEAMLAASCNSGFSEAASRLGQIPLVETVRSFGLDAVDPDGEPVGPWLDGLKTTRSGDLPFTEATRGEGGRPRSLTEEAIGLDDTRMTATTVATVVNTIANEGVMVPLRLVARCSARTALGLPLSPVEVDEGCRPEPGDDPQGDEDCERACRLSVDPVFEPATAGVIRDGMELAVAEGTASNLQIGDLGVDVTLAAKTGTAGEDRGGVRSNVGWCVAIASWGDEVRTFTTVVRGPEGRAVQGADVCALVGPVVEAAVRATL